jgi:thiamine biosynthesis protein ThiS
LKKIICNGEERQFVSGDTVADLIVDLGLKSANVVVECDGRILKPEDYESCRLRDGAILEMIHFVGGG